MLSTNASSIFYNIDYLDVNKPSVRGKPDVALDIILLLNGVVHINILLCVYMYKLI